MTFEKIYLTLFDHACLCLLHWNCHLMIPNVWPCFLCDSTCVVCRRRQVWSHEVPVLPKAIPRDWVYIICATTGDDSIYFVGCWLMLAYLWPYMAHILTRLVHTTPNTLRVWGPSSRLTTSNMHHKRKTVGWTRPINTIECLRYPCYKVMCVHHPCLLYRFPPEFRGEILVRHMLRDRLESAAAEYPGCVFTGSRHEPWEPVWRVLNKVWLR